MNVIFYFLPLAYKNASFHTTNESSARFATPSLAHLQLKFFRENSSLSTYTSVSRNLRPTSQKRVRVGGFLTDPCFALDVDSPLRWTSEEGELRVNGHPFHLKGINWFGFETPSFYPHGLWGATSLNRVFNFLRDNSFNVIRLPFSAEMALNDGQVVTVPGEPVLDKLTNIKRLAKFVDVAAEYNLLVMLDMHRLNASGGIDELWYNNDFPYTRVLAAWGKIMESLERKWNFFAIDIKNEPHGAATWGAGNPSTDWNQAAQSIIKELFERFPQWRGLAFVEGVNNPTVKSRILDPNERWWGGSLEGVWDAPIDLGYSEWTRRVVYSPHVYGPDVYDQLYFRSGNNSADKQNFWSEDISRNLSRIWDAHFGFAEKVHDRQAVVVGEWGGWYGDGPTKLRDRAWGDTFGGYLLESCLSDNFYWSLNPNSGDTGGILEDDWSTPVQPKLDLLKRIQPHPSLLYLSETDRVICLSKGQYANPTCQKIQETP
jgi:endoglucanase